MYMILCVWEYYYYVYEIDVNTEQMVSTNLHLYFEYNHVLFLYILYQYVSRLPKSFCFKVNS